KPEDPKVVAQLEGLLKDPSSPQAGELAKALVRSAKKPDQQKSVAKFLDGLSLAQLPESEREVITGLKEKLKNAATMGLAAALQELQRDLQTALKKPDLAMADLNRLRIGVDSVGKDDAASRGLFAQIEACVWARDTDPKNQANAKEKLDALL